MTETLSTFDFVAYTGLPQKAAPQSRKLVRRRAMLDFRERERRDGKKRDNGDSLPREWPREPVQRAWDSSVQKFFPKEIVEADPFDAFEVKMEPYVLDLLSSCWSPFLLLLRSCLVAPSRLYLNGPHSQFETLVSSRFMK